MMNERKLHRAQDLSPRQIIYLVLAFLLALLALLPSKVLAADNKNETIVIDGIKGTPAVPEYSHPAWCLHL